MPVSDDALKHRCEEVFADPLDTERRAAIIAALKGLEKGAALVREGVCPGAEPAGHAGFLRSCATASSACGMR